MPTKNIFLSYLFRFNAEIGLKALYDSPRDTKYLCLQRLVRFFAYGSSTLILVLYLKRLGIQETKIGLFMTLTLLGDVVISFFLTTIADRIGRRRMLAIGSVLMMMSGIVFATCGNYWVLLMASIFGVISPSGNEIGPFKPIEESAISQLVAYRERSTVLSWYYLFGTLGTAVGSLICGWVVGELHGKRHWNILNAYRVIFWAYALMGLLKLGLSLILSEDCEQIKSTGPIPKKPSETTALLPESDSQVTLVPETKRTLFPKLSERSRRTVIIFCFLTSLDAIGSGLAPNSWITFYFNKKFHLPEKALGMLFSVTSILNAVSNILSSSLVRRIGLVKTMVFTKLPSDISMIFVPFPPSVIGASVLLAIRLCTYDMNVAPRQAFITSAVLPEERTAVLGFLNVLGTLAQAVGPTIAGHLAGIGVFWIAFVLNGGLKSIYDVLLGVCFWNWRSREEEELMKDRDSDGS